MPWWSVFRRSDSVDDRTRKPSVAKKAAVPVVVAALAGGAGWFAGQKAETDTVQAQEAAGTFVEHVLGDIEDVWKAILVSNYRPANFVVFSKITNKGCGRDAAKAAFGPFYCERNDTIFLDQKFFLQIRTKSCQKMGEACEFARAQVIAHEFGHHVQNVLGDILRDDAPPIPIELQADCFSGIWAGRSNQKWKNVTPAMLTAAMEVTKLFGDDPRGGPASHGTPAQRSKWFMRGYNGKDIASCDTSGAL